MTQGVRLATVGGEMKEVVVASASDLAGSGLAQGVYLVGTGATGVSQPSHGHPSVLHRLRLSAAPWNTEDGVCAARRLRPDNLTRRVRG